MRILRNLILLLLAAAAIIYFVDHDSKLKETAIEQVSEVFQQNEKQEDPEPANYADPKFKGSIYKWVGRPAAELSGQLGEPVRKDASAYGYTWWVYTNGKNKYIQFGVEDGKILTVYAIGKNIETEPVKTGDSYKEINSELAFKDKVTYQKGLSSYTFLLKDKDMEMWPLAKIGDELFAQFYFDTFTNKLSAVRVMNADVLLRLRPYEIEYRGSLPDAPDLPEAGWKEAEAGMEKQILDITNVIRNEHGKPGLKPDQRVAEVAFGHSKDMSDRNYFSHYGLDGSGLKERLAEKNVVYVAAGENIAAQYPDAAAAMEGWLNSKGHREALLQQEYTHLGVGVYHFYYTQNFLRKP